MPLNPDVPAVEARPVIPAETQLEKVQEIISSLSISYAAEAALALNEMLSLQNRQKIGADSRLKLLKYFAPPYLMSCKGLLSNFTVMATKLIERTNSFERFEYSQFDC